MRMPLVSEPGCVKPTYPERGSDVEDKAAEEEDRSAMSAVRKDMFVASLSKVDWVYENGERRVGRQEMRLGRSGSKGAHLVSSTPLCGLLHLLQDTTTLEGFVDRVHLHCI